MPLAAPVSLAVVSASATAVALAWTVSVGADSYDVYRARASAAGTWGAFTKINGAPVLVNAYTDNAANSTPDPVAGAAYLYYVVAVDLSGSSQASNSVAATFATAAARVAGDMESDIPKILAQMPMADTASYTRFGYASVDIKGIFENRTANDDTGQGSVRNTKPCFSCATADVESAGTKDTLALQGITYKVRSVEPDGTGWTTLWLSKDGG